ncbi:hypothetical protein AC249_AIPGENE10320 [Exaiptasia diaphana]|nr:hypothetical protein AC249_AIPGENE10320 [Exaiptasia diaphana]
MLAAPPCQISEECMSILERYMVILYDRTCDRSQVNDARKQLFSQKGKSLESIPPTKAALLEHTKRACYQGGHCWGQALTSQPQLPSPQDWGWTQTSDGWQPYWTSLPDVTMSCRELIRFSCFAGHGKKTAFEVWKSHPDATTAFLMLAAPPCQISEECMSILERYMVILYDRTCDRSQVNDARKQLFSQKGKSLESIPPTKAALLEHTKRACYQGGHCWGQALTSQPQLPSPQDWGWTQTSDGWQPYWTSLPDVTMSCRELIRCKCKKSCSGRCSCFKADLGCTALCSCTCTL